MDTQIIFLGTGGSLPTKSRNLPSVVVKRKDEILMFDCGEGTQKQMLSSKIGINKKMKILISHLHGDHVLGLPGLIQTMSLLGRNKELEVYGPSGINDFLESIFKTVPFNLNYSIKVNSIDEGKILEKNEYEIFAKKTNHGIPCFAFALIEKPKPGRFYPEKARALGIPEGPLWKKLQLGKDIVLKGKIIKSNQVVGPPRQGLKIVYALDTRPCEAVLEFSRNADVLIHDSTFGNDMVKKANEYGHSTSSQAANIAKAANVKKLVLLHISPMYKNPSKLLKEAKKIFPSTIMPKDLESIKI
ncbi:MAG: ribonuclease Z [Candidatus Bathyarchaeia archaeon]